jgi:hypothetical protein
VKARIRRQHIRSLVEGCDEYPACRGRKLATDLPRRRIQIRLSHHIPTLECFAFPTGRHPAAMSNKMPNPSHVMMRNLVKDVVIV